MTYQCEQCGSDTETPGLCPVCLEMEARSNITNNPCEDIVPDEIDYQSWDNRWDW